MNKLEDGVDYYKDLSLTLELEMKKNSQNNVSHSNKVS